MASEVTTDEDTTAVGLYTDTNLFLRKLYYERISRQVPVITQISFLHSLVFLVESPGVEIGTQMWSSTVTIGKFIDGVLADYFKSAPGVRVLELGSGCGTCGILCAILGASVILTDTKKLLTHLQKNVSHNCEVSSLNPLHLTVQALDWFRPSTMSIRGFHYIMACDVVYQRDSSLALVEVFRHLTTRMSLSKEGPISEDAISYPSYHDFANMRHRCIELDCAKTSKSVTHNEDISSLIVLAYKCRHAATEQPFFDAMVADFFVWRYACPEIISMPHVQVDRLPSESVIFLMLRK